ncbi:MAG: ArsR family transcriptional regulator [Nitrososphaerota archaeon]
MNLRSIATILELCQRPRRFSELKHIVWWNNATISRHLKLLIIMGLVEKQAILEGRKAHATYFTTELGVAVLRNLVANEDLEEKPGMSISLGVELG